MRIAISDSELASIRALDLFHGMDGDAFASLMAGAYVQTFPPHVELIREGDPSDFLHVVIEGAVDLTANWNGRETIMGAALPVTTFILAATVRDAPNLMSARTAERTRLVMLPSHDVRETFDADAAFARAVVRELGQRFRTLVKATKELKLRTSVERLANELLREQARQGDAQSFELPTEKRKLALRLGMTPENLSRAFRTLQGYGVVTDGASVRLEDREALERFAKPTKLIDSPDF